ncbi:MAG: winged helix-turn-helix domain-containing protein, partial [Pseudomonadota bacterium]
MRIEFDIAKRRLTVGGAEVAVEPLVFDLIVHLARHRDRVVSKPELVDEIWGGRIIAEATLSTALKSARRALGDDGRRQDFIETLQRRGLRYVGPPPVILGLGARPGGGGTAGRGRPSIAVLPLETLSSHASQQLLAVGLRQDLTQRLARTRWLFVSARGSAGRAVEAHSDPGEIAAALGVRYLLTGAAIASGGRARVSIELIEASNAERIWAETYERPLADLFAVQDEIADRVATAVEAEIEASERRIAELRPIGDLDAWSAYHRADALLHRFEASARAQAAGFLDAAAALDPGSARIAAARSFLSWQEAFFGPARDR